MTKSFYSAFALSLCVLLSTRTSYARINKGDTLIIGQVSTPGSSSISSVEWNMSYKEPDRMDKSPSCDAAIQKAGESVKASDPEGALGILAKALNVAWIAHATADSAALMLSRGSVLIGMKKPMDALADYASAGSLYESINDVPGQIRVLSAEIALLMSQKSSELAYYAIAMQRVDEEDKITPLASAKAMIRGAEIIAQHSGPDSNMATNVAFLFYSAADMNFRKNGPKNAEPYFEMLFALSMSMDRMGFIAKGDNTIPSPSRYLGIALKLAEKYEPDLPLEADVLAWLADLELERGNKELSDGYAKRALAIAAKTKEPLVYPKIPRRKSIFSDSVPDAPAAQ